jgi:hypothetical protein
MTDPIRAALDQLIRDIDMLACATEGVSGLYLDETIAEWSELLEGGGSSRWLGDAIAAGRAALAAASPADAMPPAPACDEEQNVHRELAQWLEQHRQPAQPPAPAASTTPDLDALLSPEGAYERGTGQEDGAQLVSGPNGPKWWVPQYGCETLDNLLDRLRTRILPYLRPPVAGIDVPGGDGDYGDVMDLCAAEGVPYSVGVPLLNRARQAWGVSAPTPAPTPAPALDADTLAQVWREGWSEDGPHRLWAALADYVALAVEAQRAPSWNPPATEEDLAETRQEVAGFDNELLQMALRHLARVQARDGREYSSALCERAAEMIPPASDGEREELALLLIADAECLEAEQPDRMAMTNQQMRRSATLLRQPAPAVVPVAVAERPWEREGWCEAMGQRCWMGDPGGGGFIPSWRFCRPEDAPSMTVSLPHWAIPIPQPPQGEEVQS